MNIQYSKYNTGYPVSFYSALSAEANKLDSDKRRISDLSCVGENPPRSLSSFQGSEYPRSGVEGQSEGFAKIIEI